VDAPAAAIHDREMPQAHPSVPERLANGLAPHDLATGLRQQVGLLDEFVDQKLAEIWVRRAQDSNWDNKRVVSFGDLDLVTASEIIRDLEEITA